MMSRFRRALALPFVLLNLLPPKFAQAQEAKNTGGPPHYEEEISASNPIRTKQVKELDAYINALKSSSDRLHDHFKPDYSSPGAFEASARKLRETFKDNIGYPPPGHAPHEQAVFTPIGEDSIGTYYWASIPVLPGVTAVGIYIVPKGLKGKAPLVISMHGGGGSPEVALFHGGANYHDMVRGGVKQGYIVWAPTHLFSAEGYPGDIRNRTDDRLRLVGTSITAVEITKITRSLDVILKRPEVDSKRVAMVGLSYGGFYTLVTTALEPRIKVAVSSCYYGVQEGRYGKNELSVPSDFRFLNRMTIWRDPEIVALICPRPLMIQAGSKDNIVLTDYSVRLAPDAEAYYKKLNLSGSIEFNLFDGGHEFHDETAWAFLKKHL